MPASISQINGLNITAESSSYAVTSSYALTASYALNGGGGGSGGTNLGLVYVVSLGYLMP